jgi:hypothetical protein
MSARFTTEISREGVRYILFETVGTYRAGDISIAVIRCTPKRLSASSGNGKSSRVTCTRHRGRWVPYVECTIVERGRDEHEYGDETDQYRSEKHVLVYYNQPRLTWFGLEMVLPDPSGNTFDLTRRRFSKVCAGRERHTPVQSNFSGSKSRLAPKRRTRKLSGAMHGAGYRRKRPIIAMCRRASIPDPLVSLDGLSASRTIAADAFEDSFREVGRA